MASNFVCKFFHLLAVGQFGFGLYYDFKFISPVEVKVRGFEFGGPLIYLTILTSVRFVFKRKVLLIILIFTLKVVQVIYYAIALVNDFIPSINARKLRDYTFASFALPLAFMTSLMFWVMTSIDRELVFPKALDAFFPHWLDLILHTNVSIFAFLDAFISRHQYPGRKSAIRGLTLFMLGYLIWVYVIKMNTMRWVYGIIGVLSAPQRIAFFVICGLVALGLYFIGEMLNKFVSGRKTIVTKKMK